MARYNAGAVLLVAALLGFVDGAGPKSADREGVLLVYMGETRPYLLRLAVRVDDLPYVAIWEDAVTRIFRLLDLDKDGYLNSAEAAQLPPVGMLFKSVSPFGGDGTPSS